MPRSDLARRSIPTYMYDLRDLAAKESRIQLAIELIRENPMTSPAHIASVLNLSKSRFRHLFRQELGLSPQAFIKLTRLGRARTLLQTSFLSVKEIAALVGANDLSHFVRDYKRCYGQSPSQTRAPTTAQVSQL